MLRATEVRGMNELMSVYVFICAGWVLYVCFSTFELKDTSKLQALQQESPLLWFTIVTFTVETFQRRADRGRVFFFFFCAAYTVKILPHHLSPGFMSALNEK